MCVCQQKDYVHINCIPIACVYIYSGALNKKNFIGTCIYISSGEVCLLLAREVT